MAGINVPITVEAKNAKAEIREFNKEMKSVEQSYKLTAAEMEANGKHLEALAAKQKTLSEQLKIQENITIKTKEGYNSQSKALDEMKLKVEEAAKALEESRNKTSSSEEEIKRLEAALERANKQYERGTQTVNQWERDIEKSESTQRLLSISISETTKELELQTGKMQQASRTISEFIENYQKGVGSVQDFTNILNNAGKTMTIGLTAPFTAAAAASFVAGQEINKNLASIATLDVDSGRLKELKTDIQEIAVLVGKDTTDIADGVCSIISALGDASDTTEKIEVNAKSAAAALATTQEAIKLTTAVTKGYGDTSAEAMERVSDMAFTTLRLGQTTYSELAASIGKVVPTSNALKISQEELFNVFATLTGVTGNASEVATQYNAVLTALMKPNKELAELLKQQGYASGFAAVEALGFKGTLDMLVGAVDGSDEALVNLMGRTEAVTAMFALTGAQSGQYIEKLTEMQNALGATDAAFAAQTEGVDAAGFTFQQAMVRMQVAAQNFAETMVPVINGAAGSVEKITEWLSKLNDGQRQAIAVIAAAVAAVGPLLSVSSKLITVYTGLKSAMTATTVATTATGTAASGAAAGFTALNVAMGPIGWTVAALTAVVAAGAIAWNGYKKAQEEARQELLNTGDVLNELWGNIETTTEKANSVNELIHKWEELSEAIKDTELNASRLAQAKKELESAERQLAEASGGVITNYDLENGLIDEQIPLLKERLELEKELAALKLQQKINETDIDKLENETSYLEEQKDRLIEKAHEQKNAVEELRNCELEYQAVLLDTGIVEEERAMKLEEIHIRANEAGKSVGLYFGHLGLLEGASELANDALGKTNDKLEQAIDEYTRGSASIAEYNRTVRQLSEFDGAAEITEQAAAVEEFAETVSKAQATLTDSASVFNGLIEQYDNGTLKSKEYTEALKEQIETNRQLAEQHPELADNFNIIADIIEKRLSRTPEYLDELRNATSDLITETDTLTRAFEDQAASGELSDRVIMNLINSGYALVLQIDDETGAITLNEEVYKALTAAKIQEQIITLERSRITAVEDRLNAETEAAEATTKAMYDLAMARATASAMAEEDALKQIALLENLQTRISNISVAGIRTSSNRASSSSRSSASVRSSTSSASSNLNAEREAERLQREAEREEEEARKAQLNEWQSYYDKREELAKNWIDKEKFYNRLSYQEEMDAYDRALEYLRKGKEEAAALTFATEEEKAKIIKDFAKQIESYERQKYTAERKLLEEEISDANDLVSKREKALQKELENAETYAQKYQVYIAQREEADKKLTDKLTTVSEKFWLNEKEQLKEIEAAYEEHADKIESIDKSMYETRKGYMIQYADQWYNAQSKLLEDGYNEKRKSLDKELQAVRDYYDRLDAEERRNDRNKELGDLYAQAEIYQNAATREGQDKYKSIISQIERLQREAEKEARREEQARREAAVNSKIESLNIEYEQDKVNLTQQYEAMKSNAEKLAKDTAVNMEMTAEQVTEGLINIYDAYNNEFDKFSDEALDSVEKFVWKIAEAFRSINFSFGQASAVGGTTQSTVTNNTSSSVVLNDYGNKNFSSLADISTHWAEQSILALYGIGRGM